MNQIVILGAGLGGMIAGLSFASKGIKSLVLEKTDLNFPKDNRNIALTNYSKKFFEEIGIWEKLLPYIAPVKDVYVVDNFSSQMLHFDKASKNYDALGYMIEAENLRKIIYSCFSQNSLIDLQISADYRIDNDILYLNNSEVKSELIVVCDGKNSEVRKKYFIDSVNKTYNQSALILSVSHKKPHENTAVEHFMSRGVFAILPLTNQHESSIVWVEKPELAEIYSKMDKHELLIYLEERFGEFLGEIKIISNVQSYPLSARLTKNYYHNNLVLIGDSAHNIHPLAGQGLNQGIKDIDSLTDIIDRNRKIGLKITSTALDEYQKSRKLDNYIMYLITDNLNRIFCNKLPILSSIRKFSLSILDKMPKLKSKLVI